MGRGRVASGHAAFNVRRGRSNAPIAPERSAGGDASCARGYDPSSRTVIMRRPLSHTLRVLLVAAIYVIVARLGLLMDAVSGFATLVWPATGIGLAALVVFGYELWPGI